MMTLAIGALAANLIGTHPTWPGWLVGAIASVGGVGLLLFLICKRPDDPRVALLHAQNAQLHAQIAQLHAALEREQANLAAALKPQGGGSTGIPETPRETLTESSIGGRGTGVTGANKPETPAPELGSTGQGAVEGQRVARPASSDQDDGYAGR